MKQIILVCFILILFLSTSYERIGQGSRKVTSQKYQTYIDSLETMEYK